MPSLQDEEGLRDGERRGQVYRRDRRDSELCRAHRNRGRRLRQGQQGLHRRLHRLLRPACRQDEHWAQERHLQAGTRSRARRARRARRNRPTRARGHRHPPPAACAQYVIYAKKSDDDSLLAFAFDKPLHFAAATAFKYKVTLTCDGDTRTTGTMDLTVFSAENPATFSNEFEQKVSQVREKVLGLGLGLGGG